MNSTPCAFRETPLEGADHTKSQHEHRRVLEAGRSGSRWRGPGNNPMSVSGDCGVDMASCAAESSPRGPVTMSGDIWGCLDWGCYWPLGVQGPGLLLTLPPCRAEGDATLVVSPAVGQWVPRI